ncbi:FAD-dependent oxidoreductase [Sporichthya polymorpha]|uniref:FAD-dependent oxidoreductase n=1 Tax=Sporichthya polymorpha TaxID=35751 RepID=UPI000A0126A8|nr:FAD-dependent oxidoreductase [Sporichthya polymorpha]
MSASDVSADFVVVGTGIGGVTAAIVAADAGLDVVLVERADKVGGVSGISGGLVWMPRTRYAEGYEGSAAAVDTYLVHVGAGFSEEPLRRRYLDTGPEAVHYLADNERRATSTTSSAGQTARGRIAVPSTWNRSRAPLSGSGSNARCARSSSVAEST